MTSADAVQAAELAALRAELVLMREQQAATAEVLKSITAAPGDLARTLPQIGTAAQRLCGADHVAIIYGDVGNAMVWDPVRGFRTSAAFAGIPMLLSIQVETQQTGAPVRVAGPIDTWSDRFPFQAQLFRSEGLDEVALICVPMIGRKVEHGTVLLRRNTATPFTDSELSLLEGFADQALVAVENARLFKNLGAALEREQAVSDILRIIGTAPGDAHAVFDAIAESAAQHVPGASVGLLLRDGDTLRNVVNVAGDASVDFSRATAEFPVDLIARMDGELVYESDLANGSRAARSAYKDFGFASRVIAKLVNRGEFVGLLFLAKGEAFGFSAEQVALARSFADQAVIAIENARLFRELEERNREVSEALEQQTAIAEVLEVISSSPNDLENVLNQVLGIAARLCDADSALIWQERGDQFRVGASHGFTPAELALIATIDFQPRMSIRFRASPTARLGGSTSHPTTFRPTPHFGA